MRSWPIAAFVILMASSCARAEETAAQFAERVRGIVVSGDASVFRTLPCYPAPCIDDDVVEFVIGTKKQRSFVGNFLANKSVAIKIFGPYTYADEVGAKSYAVMFYDPKLVKFNEDGNLSKEDRERLWWNGYVETVVLPVDSGWGFHNSPFYYGTEPPWMGDY